MLKMDKNTKTMIKTGDKVICIETAYDNSTIKDEIYEVEGISKCCETNIYLKGITYYKGYCNKCGTISTGSPNKASRFVPIQEKFEKITFEKVIEMVEIGVN